MFTFFDVATTALQSETKELWHVEVKLDVAGMDEVRVFVLEDFFVLSFWAFIVSLPQECLSIRLVIPATRCMRMTDNCSVDWCRSSRRICADWILYPDLGLLMIVLFVCCQYSPRACVNYATSSAIVFSKPYAPLSGEKLYPNTSSHSWMLQSHTIL